MTKLFNKLPTWLLALMFLIGISLATALLTFILIAVPTKILLPRNVSCVCVRMYIFCNQRTKRLSDEEDNRRRSSVLSTVKL